MSEGVQYYTNRVPMTIPNGAQVPVLGVNCQGQALVGVKLPSTFDGTAFTVEESDNKTTGFQGIIDNAGVALGATGAAASKTVWLDGRATLCCQFVRINCGTAQTGDTVLTLIFRRLA